MKFACSTFPCVCMKWYIRLSYANQFFFSQIHFLCINFFRTSVRMNCWHCTTNRKHSVVLRLMFDNLCYETPNMVSRYITHIIQVISSCTHLTSGISAERSGMSAESLVKKDYRTVNKAVDN